jgi:hypothetical protein
MGNLIREGLGWLLIFLGLAAFFIAFSELSLERPNFVNASIMAAIGFVIFRGGIQLVKMAAAVRLVTSSQLRMKKPTGST